MAKSRSSPSITISNIGDATEWFEILQTTERSQTAVMVLSADGTSSEEMNVHEKSDQVLLVVEGEVEAEVGEAKRVMHEGDSCIVAAGTPHRFSNHGKGRAVTFNVYSPPEYPENEKG
jgi:mannose-6-phosphate isomerase-like protein (cupin superfamily)